MTVGTVSLAGIQDTLAELQADGSGGTGAATGSGAATGTGAATGSGAVSAAGSTGDATDFATTLAEATAGGGTGAASLLGDELDATAASPSGSVSPSGLLQPLSATSSSSSGDSELLSLLMAAVTGGAGSASGLDAVSGTTGAASGSGGVTGSDVVAEAAQFEGTPYVWGGTSPSGFDCSGLVQYVYGQLGVSLPRTSEEQSQVGTAVDSLAAAQPGDLVFFAGSDGTASAPGHVGIYVGNGQMIDAPHTGTSVQVQPVSSAGTVVAIRRVLPTGAPAGNGADAATGAATLASEVTSTGGSTFGNVTVPGAYASTVEQAAEANGIPASLLAAVLQQESGFNPGAVSSAGAEGIAQFMPSTAAGLGIDPLDPTQAIEGCAQLLGSYTRQFGSYADAAAAYNAGPGAVSEYGGVPPYAETQAYVPAVLSLAGLSGSTP